MSEFFTFLRDLCAMVGTIVLFYWGCKVIDFFFGKNKKYDL